MTKTLKPSPERKSRSLLVELPIPIADALDYAKLQRQQREGRLISKKQIVREAVEQFLKSSIE